MPGGGGKSKISARDRSIIRMKRDPQQMESMKRICANPSYSNTWRCDQMRQAQHEMRLGQETPTKDTPKGDIDLVQLNSGLNFWMTHLDALISTLKVLDEETSRLTTKHGFKMNMYAKKALEATRENSRITKLLLNSPSFFANTTSVASTIYTVATTKPDEHDKRFTAYANFCRDMFLLGLSKIPMTKGLGVFLGVLNSLLVAGDPDWFPKLLKNPNGELARKITEAAEKRLAQRESSGRGRSSQEWASPEDLSEFSRNFRKHSPFY